MRHLIVAAALATCLAPAGLAAEAPSRETLIVPAYPEDGPWKRTALKQNEEMSWFESVPEKESSAEVRNSLTEQRLFLLKGVAPTAFLSAMAERLSGACEGLQVQGLKEQTENGYPVAYALIHCENQKTVSLTADIAVKVIGGKDALYVVQREFRHPIIPPDSGSSEFPAHKMMEIVTGLRTSGAYRYLTSQVRLCPASSCAAP